MKKLTVILIIAAFGVIFNSCKQPAGPAENSFFSLFPSNLYNYWVYKTTWVETGNNINAEYIDSMVVGKIISGGEEPVVIIAYYRDGVYYDGFEVQICANRLNLLSYGFSPLLGYFNSMNFCGDSFYQPKPIAAETPGGFRFIDTTYRDSVLALSEDPPGSGNYKTDTILSLFILDYVLNQLPDKPYTINDTNYNSNVFNLNGYLESVITSPVGIHFNKKAGCQYYDNGRRYRKNEFNLNMSFVRGIGIVRTDGYIYACDSLVHKHTRELLRYKIN